MIIYHSLNLLSINLPKFFFIHVLHDKKIRKFTDRPHLDLPLAQQICMGMFPYPMLWHVKIVNYSGGVTVSIGEKF